MYGYNEIQPHANGLTDHLREIGDIVSTISKIKIEQDRKKVKYLAAKGRYDLAFEKIDKLLEQAQLDQHNFDMDCKYEIA